MLHIGTKIIVYERELLKCDEPLSVLAFQEGISPIFNLVFYLVFQESWIVVDKPALKHVHPKLITENQTILNSVYHMHPSILGVGNEGIVRSGVVHRLDFETSGIVVSALQISYSRCIVNGFKPTLLERSSRSF